MTGPSVVVEAAGITVHQEHPMTAVEARQVAMALLQAATADGEPVRELRRHVAVGERLRDLEGGV